MRFLLSLLGFIVSTQAQLAINILQPQPGYIVEEQVRVTASIDSGSELVAVNAFVDSRTNQLALVGGNWTSTVNLSGLPSGAKILAVTARDVTGVTQVQTASIMLDRKPQLEVLYPTNGAIARGTISVQMSSSDGLGRYSIWIAANKQILATNEVNSLDLSGFDHSPVALSFAAIDSQGRQTRIDRWVYVEGNPRLTEIPYSSFPPAQPSSHGFRAERRHFNAALGGIFSVLTSNNVVVLDEVTGRAETNMISNMSPFWDGRQIVYTKRDAFENYYVGVWNSSEIWVSQKTIGSPYYYRSTNGWTPYTVAGNSGQAEIWVKPLAGPAVKRTSFNSRSTIEAINPKGELIFSNQGTNWISLPDASLYSLGRYLDRTAWVNDQWMVFIGDHAFRLNTSRIGSPTISIEQPAHGVFEVRVQDGIMEVSDDMVHWAPVDGSVLREIKSRKLRTRFYRVR